MTAARGAAWLAIVNPASGHARTRALWTACERALRARGLEVDVAETTAAREGERIARRAVLDGRRKLLAVGGDGSVHEVVNGIMSVQLPAADRVTLAQAPFGTGNDWALGLGLPRSPEGVAAMLARGATRPHDVGVLEFAATATRAGSTRFFINVAGTGFDAYVLERLPASVPSRRSYLAGLLRGLFTYRPARYRLTAGAMRTDDERLVIFASIGAYCGGGMHVAPCAANDDGLLELVAIRYPGRFGVLRRLAKLYDGTLLGDSAVTHARVDRVAVASAPETAVEADGQLVGQTPVVVSVVRHAIDAVFDTG